MTAVEALRRARATMNHGRGGGSVGCEGWASVASETWDLVVNADIPDPQGTSMAWHDRCASALLDGFTVEEVTAAEHTTDQPHE